MLATLDPQLQTQCLERSEGGSNDRWIDEFRHAQSLSGASPGLASVNGNEVLRYA